MRFPFESKVLIKISLRFKVSINKFQKTLFLFSKHKMSEDNNYAGYETAPQDRDTKLDRAPSLYKIDGPLIRFSAELDK